MYLVGDKSEFAIEYALTGACPPPYGYLRLWIAGLPLGDLTEAMHLYHGLSTLKKCTQRNLETGRMMCNSASGLPDPESALRDSYLSLGEAHDYYELAIYTITSEQRFRFYWREFKRSDSPTDSVNPLHQKDVSWNTFDQIVLSVTGAIEARIMEESGMGFSFD